MTLRLSPFRGVLCAALIIPAACGRETPASTVVLDQPEATLDQSFQQVSNVVELRDGRIALAELQDRTFLFADFATGRIETVGQHADSIGPGDPAPGRHKLPGFVLRFPGDTVGLVDFAAERTTLWTEDGQFVATVAGRGVGGTNQPLAYDALGRGYKEDVRAVLGGLEPGAQVTLDSLNVLRIDLRRGTADTVAQLKLPVWGEGRFGEQVKMVSTIFSGRDLFGVLPDGSVWVARAATNAVDWRAPDGAWSQGPPRPFERVPVPAEEKAAFLDRLRQQMSRMGAPAGIELQYPFADEKPPFAAAATSAAGEVWLQRSRPWGDSLPVWDVVGRDGRQVRTVQLPHRSSLAGFGRDGRVYVLLRDSDGRQRIGRFVVR